MLSLLCQIVKLCSRGCCQRCFINLCILLLQVVEGSFIKENVDELCWTLTAKKNYQTDKTSSTVLPEKDAFRLWCLFNFLSEDKYPLVMVPDEVGSSRIHLDLQEFLHTHYNFYCKTDTLYPSMLLGM